MPASARLTRPEGDERWHDEAVELNIEGVDAEAAERGPEGVLFPLAEAPEPAGGWRGRSGDRLTHGSSLPSRCIAPRREASRTRRVAGVHQYLRINGSGIWRSLESHTLFASRYSRMARDAALAARPAHLETAERRRRARPWDSLIQTVPARMRDRHRQRAHESAIASTRRQPARSGCHWRSSPRRPRCRSR